VRHALTGLTRDPQAVIWLAADEVGEFLGVLLRLSGGQVDLVEYGMTVRSFSMAR
jgi:hypothetical protein